MFFDQILRSHVETITGSDRALRELLKRRSDVSLPRLRKELKDSFVQRGGRADTFGEDPLKEFFGATESLRVTYNELFKAKVVQVPHEQALWFCRLDSLRQIRPREDLRLPFPVIFFDLGGRVPVEYAPMTDFRAPWRVGQEPQPIETMQLRGILLYEHEAGWMLELFNEKGDATRQFVRLDELPEFDYMWHSYCPNPCPLRNSHHTLQRGGNVLCRSFGRDDECLYARGARRLLLLAINLVLLIVSPNIELHLQAPPPAKRSQRKKKRGSAPLPLRPYYTIALRGRHASEGAAAVSGRRVSFAFDVRGHFRRLPDGRLTWIRPHVRGTSTGIYRPAGYRITERRFADYRKTME